MDLSFLSTLWDERVFRFSLGVALGMFLIYLITLFLYLITLFLKKVPEPNGKPVKVTSLPDGEYYVLMRREVATSEGQQILFVLGKSDMGESVRDKIVRDKVFCHVREDMVDIGEEATWETLSIRRYEGLLRVTLRPERVLEPRAKKELVIAGEK